MSESLDAEGLLAEFKQTGSETAFHALVERFGGLVFSTALRQLNGDSHLAEDVVQKVFADLAQKASQLRPDGGLGGWLHCHTCFVSANLRKSEQRRRVREQAAGLAEFDEGSTNANWSIQAA